MNPSTQPPLWRKSRHSGTNENCVEVADLDGGARAVRDSKVTGGPVLQFSSGAWRAFTAGLRGDQL
ncbi:DUF397 domain-containing protein [Sphaerisporangium aureirubrum]|uniref:DUF397 domain-containing protein n=1 Tax=Sphaerisporangium aureirubrum TaxID=1544736 RepID=A0ABW1NSN4_9ACTN